MKKIKEKFDVAYADINIAAEKSQEMSSKNDLTKESIIELNRLASTAACSALALELMATGHKEPKRGE